jgi:hypothetical protein
VDAIDLALQAMGKAKFPIRSLVVFSDGGENASVYRMQELERLFAESPIPIFLVMPDDNRGLEHVYAWFVTPESADLVRFASQSGGYAIPVASEKEMLGAAAQISSLIHSPYVISLPILPTEANLKALRIKVHGVRPEPALLYRAILSSSPP